MTDLQEKLASPLISEMFDLAPLSSCDAGCFGWFDRRTELAFQLGPEIFQRPADSFWRFRMDKVDGLKPLLIANFSLMRSTPGRHPIETAIYDVEEKNVLEYFQPNKYWSPDELETRIDEFEPRYHEGIRQMSEGTRRNIFLDHLRVEAFEQLGGRENFLSIVVAAIRACHVRWRSTHEGGKPIRNWADRVEVRILR